MALTCGDPQPESGKGLHTQESGDSGFSADMQHNFSVDYKDNMADCRLPVANKGSSVRPMSNEALEISELKVISNEMPQQLALELEPFVSAGEEVADLRKRKQLSPYPEEQPFQKKMDRGPEELFPPCWPKRKARNKHPGSERTTKRRSRNIKWKSFTGMCCCILAVGLVGVREVSAGNLEPTSDLKNNKTSAHGSSCFICKDKDRCPNLIMIFAENDVLVYDRPTKENIPNCTRAPPITHNCSVCWSQSDVNIYCSNNIRKFEAEDSNGSAISNITKGCKYKALWTFLHAFTLSSQTYGIC
ncbi:hypothetical protein ATANTOWER_012825 [Ataeniobius toweri]|uniref:Uncharacterized protein n=1 Tax=Ataeniobius toweri TaxID=208326 RepID=A0ABU7AF46_9TELE|nr:hypothetical protein [Ataeniobius toweri]